MGWIPDLSSTIRDHPLFEYKLVAGGSLTLINIWTLEIYSTVLMTFYLHLELGSFQPFPPRGVVVASKGIFGIDRG